MKVEIFKKVEALYYALHIYECIHKNVTLYNKANRLTYLISVY